MHKLEASTGTQEPRRRRAYISQRAFGLSARGGPPLDRRERAVPDRKIRRIRYDKVEASGLEKLPVLPYVAADTAETVEAKINALL